MTQPSFPVDPAVAGTPFGGSDYKYALSDDLARMCLPAEFKDSYRNLAWANSICFLFLVIGLVGVKAPKIVERPLTEILETVPVTFTPPEEQSRPEPEVKQDEPEPQETMDTPQIAAIVAAEPSSAIAFSVPVKGAVAVASPRYATPPPLNNHVPSAPVKFNPNATDGGIYPKPNYPGFALRNRSQGTVTIEIMVDSTGAVTDAKVLKTSGFTMLDESAVETVKTRWRFPPGGKRDYVWDCIFKLEQ
jgi:protein TonB